MKIYFGFTMRGDRAKLQGVKELVELLRSRGHTILTDHVFDENFAESEARFSDEHIYERDMAWLQQADIILTEVSGSSFGIGFEIGFVLAASDKKVYIFYDENIKEKISKMATGNTHPNCIRVPYRDFSELREFIEKNF